MSREHAVCPSCGSPDKSWRRVIPGTSWGRVCNDGWHQVAAPLIRCRGCGEMIGDGVAWVTVRAARHVISVPSHEAHREAARASALGDTSWQRDQSHYAG